MNSLGQREYARLIKAEGVRRIEFHGLRHTCATLLLQAGEPVQVVSERLGRSKVSMTMEVYAHVLPDKLQRGRMRRQNSVRCYTNDGCDHGRLSRVIAFEDQVFAD